MPGHALRGAKELMMRKQSTIVSLILLCMCRLSTPAAADQLGDAIRQAEEAKAESERMSRSAEEGRQKARQLYEQAKLVKFQLGAEHYVSARSQFDRSADAFNSARYSLELFQKYGHQSHVSDAERSFRQARDHYNEAVAEARKAAEWINGGIDEYNRQLRDERKKKADQNRTDAFDLQKKIENAIRNIEGKPASAGAVSCLNEAKSRARWAFGEFHSAVENADRVETYNDKTQSGIRYYNEALEIVKQTTETGKCKR